MTDLLSIVESLIAVPSVSHDRDACARVLEVVDALVPSELPRETINSDGVRSLIISSHARRTARIILNAHLDVVPARDSQFAVQRVDGKMLGRGVYDMKAAAAVYVRLLQDIARLSADRRPDVQVQFVTDEEVGGARGAKVLLREGFLGDVFIAGEPTNLDICHRSKGIVWITVRYKGQPGHAAMPWQSHNPTLPLLDGLAKIRARWPQPEAEVWRTTASITGLRAGEAHNRIPQSAEVDLDIRRVPEESVENVLDFVRASFTGAVVDVRQIGDALDTPADDTWIKRLGDLQASMLGHRPRLYGEHFASDARFYSAASIPAFCWGPRGGGMHADDEWLDVESLFEYERVLRAFVELV